QHRIPEIGHDELGMLGQAFNQMLEDLRDLELARVLQERIYPSKPLELANGWEIYGHCRSASEVGGDFYDYFLLPDGCCFLVVGDVSGHGTPSALIVAMAKGLFSHPRNKTEPGQILHDVQVVFGRVLPRKRMMMTCFVGIFDPRSGLLRYGNAGHNYPYLIHADGRLEPLRDKTMPLGVGKKSRNQTTDLQLADSDTLFLYTDGLVEALRPDQEMIGYDAVQQQLSSLDILDAHSAVHQLRTWHDGQTAAGPQADDITLVFLKRHPMTRAEFTTRQ
ncbi:MAG TPA: SpoIIE family protein phosphatase, partial [Candidatus Ozemobacteraceae bacterium]|nr:SpoIIE family protein phosphatase [Candidatus Ozemobacteraceae bacterium]